MDMLLFTLMLSFFVLILVSLGTSEDNSPAAVPALYVFGDSLFDCGNNNLLPTLAKANYPPYGMDFERGPTGRFTNGKVVVDFIAEFLGLPYPPPYLSLGRTFLGQDQWTGLNFASGSCGILPETGNNFGECLNLAEQVNFFEEIVEEELRRHYQDTADQSNYLSKSVFAISIGSNDYINNYLDKRKRYSPQDFAKLLIDSLSWQLQRLYKLGARKVVAFEIGPIGCIPSTMKRFKHSGPCVEDINQMAVIFNNQLAAMLESLTSSLQGSAFILGQAHWLGYDAIINPSNYDLSDSSNACCVTWLNGTSGCIPELRVLACKNPERHYFWDGYHLTETMYKTIATLCFNGSSVCVPKNIKELLQV